MFRPCVGIAVIVCLSAFAGIAVPAGAEGPFSAINRTANDAHTPIIDAPDTVKAGEPFAVTPRSPTTRCSGSRSTPATSNWPAPRSPRC
jgi:hypothetical protein